jgi:hypothetical protein
MEDSPVPLRFNESTCSLARKITQNTQWLKEWDRRAVRLDCSTR